MPIERIGIPLGTRLNQIVRMPNGDIHVWTAIKRYEQDYYKQVGTYICINPNGLVTHVTIEPNLAIGENTYVIKDKNHD